MDQRDLGRFWGLSPEEALSRLESSPQGLRSEEALRRLKLYGPNLPSKERRRGIPSLLLNQFRSPIILILVFAASVSFFLHDPSDGIIILSIVLISGLLGFWQEKGAADAAAGLLSLVKTKARVLRDGKPVEADVEALVPGDVILLAAGSSVPGDCLILESTDLYMDEAVLTGETFPVEKRPGVLPADTPLSGRTNTLFMGTHVVSGEARALVVLTGRDTEFGKISDRLRSRAAETEFERGVSRFGYMLMEVTLILVLFIFAVNVAFHRPVLDSLLFSLALAVGLTPQLLPAIISVNLSHGARRMAQRKVIVKVLASIENFGSMNVLCSDKTGTLTRGEVHLDSALGPEGRPDRRVLHLGCLNAALETGFPNPIDEALRRECDFDLSAYRKLDEIPYDFLRKRLSILVENGEGALMVTKGALDKVLEICTHVDTSDGETKDLKEAAEEIHRLSEEKSRQGLRLLGVAYRRMRDKTAISTEEEKEMTFAGLLVFHDPPKPGVEETVRRLRELGVELKVITGDSPLTAGRLGEEIGMASPRVLTGTDLHHMSDEALLGKVNEVDIFASIEPNQKERIILALKKAGNVVGFMGDGINDAPALHAADVGISVDGAVDVAKEAAQIVLLEKDLEVLVQGVMEGRKTFNNTLKYVFMATSANFGNMFSMAGASLFLPFLPMLPGQILLTNLLTDFPEMGIATDNVDQELVQAPRRWDVKFIRRFMLVFGPLSSLFDFLTFGALMLLLHADASGFRTGWFMESVVSASLVVLIIRTRKPFFRSRPGKFLAVATFLVILTALALPFTPLGEVFGFRKIPPAFLPVLALIVLLYALGAELTKRLFYRHLPT
ncbi:magnesium-translocating P-type ATPase [Candidatus Solincola tengchongensis]|uniref:magnesium-translocating P-type ATPase n=1 Tax=Candidatus Solincola tengchongensis TaxID=2900693 RepID=UPI00257F815E|nr:magnesium-translocating P-type ATPase [Candidatus Solincola tengchongensis]